tara:strand:+ start:2610 stop:3230 length:621 start_codon:yes stop_codon:yes gene_type:complete
MDIKQFELIDFKSESTEDGHYITGYANTKGKKDAYGDIPTSLDGAPVYDLSAFKRNPIALVDHQQSVGNIFGAFIIGPGATEEDEKGLKIKLRLMDDPQTDIAKHAVSAYKSGFARAFSIGGRWSFDDKANPTHLTKAVISEISGVAIGADSYALSGASKLKSGSEVTEEASSQKVIEELVKVYRATKNAAVLETIKCIKERNNEK